MVFDKRFAHQPEYGFLVFGVVVAGKVLAFHFEHDHPVVGYAMAHGEDEVRIDLLPAPALQRVVGAGDIAVPPSQRTYAVEIDRDIAFVLA